MEAVPCLKRDHQIPARPEEYLQLTFKDDDFALESRIQNGLDFPLADSEIMFPTLKRIKLLASTSNHKDVLEITLDLENNKWTFMPGDTVGIVPSNDPEEVEKILSRLGIQDKLDCECVLSRVNSEETKGKPKKLPPHLPLSSVSLRRIFESCVEIRGPPKKLFLRALAEYTSDMTEKEQLLKCCSREGSKEYERLFSTASPLGGVASGLLQLLETFPSCTPPAAVVLQHLPRLRARPYSIASSLLKSECLRIIFSVYKEKSRKGVCTALLETFLFPTPSDLEGQLASLSLSKDSRSVPLFFRKSSGFRLPDDCTIPLILVGPGTGVAPFIGFLEHLTALKESNGSMTLGEVWLFYGCRYPEGNHIYEDYLKKFVERGIISRLFLSFSQFSGNFNGWNGCKYVQDNIKANGGAFVDQLVDKEATLYVAGDASNMFKDVKEMIIGVTQEHKGLSHEEASQMIKTLIKKKKYLEDVWM